MGKLSEQLKISVKIKPVVIYRPSKEDIIVEGKGAILLRGCVDHYSANVGNEEYPVYTTKVVKKDGLFFETLNTRYVPNGEPQ